MRHTYSSLAKVFPGEYRPLLVYRSASHLMAALKVEDPQAEFRFFGGDLMAAVGWNDGEAL